VDEEVAVEWLTAACMAMRLGLGGLRRQPYSDIAQAPAIGMLREGHDDDAGPAGCCAVCDTIIVPVAGHDRLKGLPLAGSP
jgi:hypothetical protein